MDFMFFFSYSKIDIIAIKGSLRVNHIYNTIFIILHLNYAISNFNIWKART